MNEKPPAGPYPDNNPKTAVGATKPPTHAIPPVAILHLGLAMENGEQKYGLFNYREFPVSASVYYDAAMRHLLSWWDGEDVARDSGIPHLAHVMACCAILLDQEDLGVLNDDRGRPGSSPRFIEQLTELRAALAGDSTARLVAAVDALHASEPNRT